MLANSPVIGRAGPTRVTFSRTCQCCSPSGHVLADLPVLLAVAGDHERSGPALPGRVIEVVQLGAPDTQLAGREGHRFVPGYRVEEIADAAMSRRAERAGHLAPNRL